MSTDCQKLRTTLARLIDYWITETCQELGYSLRPQYRAFLTGPYLDFITGGEFIARWAETIYRYITPPSSEPPPGARQLDPVHYRIAWFLYHSVHKFIKGAIEHDEDGDFLTAVNHRREIRNECYDLVIYAAADYYTENQAKYEYVRDSGRPRDGQDHGRADVSQPGGNELG